MNLHSKNCWLKTNQYSPKNIQLLASGTFKSKIGVWPELINDIFHFVVIPYN